MLASVSITYRADIGKSVFRFVVEPILSATEGFMKVSQVIGQHKDKSKLPCRLEVKIGQDVEGQV